VRRGILQSLPVSCHFRGCKVPLFRIVSGAISSELALPFFYQKSASLTGTVLVQAFNCAIDESTKAHPF